MMKKKIIPGFLAAALTVSGLFVVPAVSVEAAEDSHPVRLVDYAELLDDTEYTEMESKLDRISEEYDCDVAVITEDSILYWMEKMKLHMQMTSLIIMIMAWEKIKAAFFF